MWPIEVQGHRFLAAAILEAGPLLFSDWTGDEPYLWFVPAMDSSRRYVEDGHDAAYASSLLRLFRPDLFAQICSRNGPPLLNEEWYAAEEIYRTHIHTPRALAATKMAAIHKRMTVALANGDLVSVTRTDGKFRAIPPDHWVDESISYARFLESQMDPSRPNIQNWPTALSQIPPFASRPTLVPGNDWIFVTAASLEAFLNSLKASSKSPPIQTRHYTDDAIDAELKKLYAEVAASGVERPVRDGPGGVVDLMRQRLPGVPVDQVKARYTQTRPPEWKQGKRSVH